MAAALLSTVAFPAFAQSATWTGSADSGNPDGNWNTSGNWSGGAVPSATANFGTVPVVPPLPPSTVIVDVETYIETIRFDGATAYNINITSSCGCGELFVTGAGVINNSGVLQTVKVDGGGLVFLNSSTITGNVTINNTNGGIVWFGTFGGTDTASAGSATIINDGTNFSSATLFLANTTAGNARIEARNGGYVLFGDNSTGGNARFVTDNNLASVVDFSSSAGPNGDGVLTAGSIEGGGTFVIGDNLIVGSNNQSTTIFGALIDCGCGGPGTLTKVGSGTLTFAAGIDLSQFLGSLVVNGGTVVMDGDMSAALAATANAGGTLAGAGILPSTFIGGYGTLSPGNGTTGNIATLQALDLQFDRLGTYAVDVAPTDAAGVIAPGTAADFTLVSTGAYVAGSAIRATGIGGRGYTIGAIYPILQTSLGIGGSGFSSLYIAGSFGSTKPILVYDDPSNPFIAYLQLIQGEVSSQLTPGASQNQKAVAAALDKALLNGADFGTFTPLYNLTGDAFLKALDQLSGEASTGVFQAVYQSVGNFINTMLNPFAGGRSGFGPATSYAPQNDESDAYAPKRRISRQAEQAFAAAMPVKAAPEHDNRYAIWASGYGGQTSVDANAVVGSHDTNVRGYGFAAGLDFRVSPDALVGFALAGGHSSWGVAEGLGGGNPDNFHLGGYGSLRFGPAYLSAAVAYGRHWVTGKRSLFVPGFASIESDYDANSFGGRLEAGYRYGLGSFGITPYAALQASVVRVPGYLEKTTSGDSSFALQYDRQNDSLVRTELGSWFDQSLAIQGGVMTLRARAAWAHDDGADRALNAAFPALPGSSFLVQGASPGTNFALLSAGAEWRYGNGMSFAARFDSELSDKSRGFGGTGVFRYVW